MQIIDALGVLIAVAGGGGIGVFLTSAHHERVRSQQRAYEKEMAEHRDLYAALAMRQRLKPDGSSQDEEDPAW